MRLSSKLLEQGYVKEHLKSSQRKFHGRYRDLIKQYDAPSPESYTTFWRMTIYSDTLLWSGFTWIFDLVTELDLIIEFDFLPNCARFPLNICNGCGMPTEDAYHSGHLVLSHFGTCMCSNVETNLPRTCLVSGLLSFKHPSVLPFYFRHLRMSTS